MRNHREISQLPVKFYEQIVISKPTNEFIQVDVENISILTNGKSQISIKASSTFFNRTVGLCGTFNHQRADDFTTPNNDITTSAFILAEEWMIQKQQCQFTPIQDCDVEDYTERREICEHLQRNKGLFSGCLEKVAPEVYYEQCMEALCACSSSASECLCPFISYYSQLCSNKGASSEWLSHVPQCAVECHQGMRYQLCSSVCHSTCTHRSFYGPNCTHSACVEGCACPAGQSLTALGVCVPHDACLCYFEGREYPDGFRQTRHHHDCECQKGLWHCEASAEERDGREIENVEIECQQPNEVFSQCVTPCEPTCKNLKPDPAGCSYGLCKPGCTCVEGYVRDHETGQCISRNDCPCFHGGLHYNEGESIYRECNKCTCVNSAWQCADAPCPGACDVWGDTHVKTFDGQIIDFNGTCEYVVVRAESRPSNSGWFQVILRNSHCSTHSIDCQKSVVIQYEGYTITFIRNTWILSGHAPVTPERIGLYTKVILPSQLAVYWDGHTRLHVIAWVQWKEKLAGLCGNYNGDDSDDIQVTIGGPQVHSVAEFVQGWQLHQQCVPPTNRDLICTEPLKLKWAQTQCAVLTGPYFEDCRGEVDVQPYLKRCLADACSCSEAGDCECLCNAIGAYAHRCAQRGVLIHWRHQELCPMQCDEECERYTPCVPDVCASSQTCKVAIQNGVQLDCLEPVCVEGCALPKCKPGYIRLNESTDECVPSSQCNENGGAIWTELDICNVEGESNVYREGERVPSQDKCVSCFCMREGKIQCIGKPCPDVTTETLQCVDGWSNWRSDNSPPDAFGRDLEYLVYHQCPPQRIKSLECRRIHDHEAWNYSTVGVTCDKSTGLECTPNNLQPCDDWEIRVQCSCPAESHEIVPIHIPVPMKDERTCPNGQEWLDCGVDCSQTCLSYRKELMRRGHCLDKECFPGCRNICPPDQVLIAEGSCVPLGDCPCILPSGEIVPPGEVRTKDECTECQCQNDMICHTLSNCEQNGSTELNETRVLPPDPTEGCWTQWISTDTADGAGDFEKLRSLIDSGLVCRYPKAIQCQTKESHLSSEGIDWTATGQTLTCSIHSGLSCFHTANPSDGCYDYQVKFYCPCDEVDHTIHHIVSPAPSPVVIEFLCPEANGLFPDAVNCDHFYHCSNNFPFHKPCGAGTLFNPVLKICDHPENVQCVQREILVPMFECPMPTGIFRDPRHCNWFYQCVQGVAYHKLCPAGLSFNPQTSNCEFVIAGCVAETVTMSPDITPAGPPLPPPVVIFACPEVGFDAIANCNPCETNLLCDGKGNCVPPEACPCVRDGKHFPVGGRLETSTCQVCSCQLAGHSMCRPIVCPLCQNGVPGSLDNQCRCMCGETSVECPYRCGNGRCLDVSQWCDGIQDCDIDELLCSNQINLEASPLPSYSQVLGPATCELIGNHLRTFDGQEFSYDYCHNVLVKDVANGLFSVSVSRECSSPSQCEPQVFFEGGSQQIRIFPQSQTVLVNGQSFTPAQLASAAAFGGAVKIIVVGDVIELAFRGQEVKLVLTRDSVKAIVDARFSTQLMGLCGLFNYNGKDDLTNSAGMPVDNAKLFGDGWALLPSPGSLCVSHACKPEVTLEAMEICGKLSLPPLSGCTGPENAFKDCLAATCQCLQSNRSTQSCICDAYTTFQTACVNKHGNQIINHMVGWRQLYSCAPKCPPDEEYHDCGPSCVVTCQNFFETGQLTCASNDSGVCIPGCFCPSGLVLDYTSNACIEPENCADKVCVGYGDPQMKTFDGWSFSLGKAGEFNIASDRDGLFSTSGVNAPCKERMSCIVGLEVTHKGHIIKVKRNQWTEIDGEPFPDELLPWKAPSSTLSVFSLQRGSHSTTVVSLTALGVQIHYSNENAAFSIHVPSKKFFDKMEGLCGNCNNDAEDDLQLKDGETTDDIYHFICSWGHFETERNRRECVMELDNDKIQGQIPPAIIETCEQAFNNPTTFAACHALVSYQPYSAQCSKEAIAFSMMEEDYKSAMCNSALEYSRRCCEHGISLQWWTNLGCNTTCAGDLIYSPCTDACPQTCAEFPENDECRRIKMDGCICPPEHVRDGTRCVLKTEICTTPVEDCAPVPMADSVSVFEHVDLIHGRCTNPTPVAEAVVCSGACNSVSLYKRENDFESACGCCVPVRSTPISVELSCGDGAIIRREFRQPTLCKCQPCGSLDSRATGIRGLRLNATNEESTEATIEEVPPTTTKTSADLRTEIIRLTDGSPEMKGSDQDNSLGVTIAGVPKIIDQVIENESEPNKLDFEVPDAQ
ncbi:Hemocytin-like [Tropilaelaps mercedesae]|uniref:Hemocytin-like n=1 Tax=Tropilaelaps mercedesae TaxID=418985 RepID=A0A1V9X658_9ACAR|nr:Hemocytin-like [Tropilaelaps mercedesae]